MIDREKVRTFFVQAARAVRTFFVRAARAVWTFFVQAGRVVLYPVQLVVRVLGRSLLLVSPVAPLVIPPAGFFLLFEPATALVRNSPAAMQVVVFLTSAGLFPSVLQVFVKSAWKELGEVGKAFWKIWIDIWVKKSRREWLPSWAVKDGLAATWHENFAKIPREFWQNLKSAQRLTLALIGAAVLAVVAYPLLLDRPVQTVDRYVVVVDARDAGGPVGDPTGGPVGDPTGGPVGDPTGGPVGDPTGGPVGDPTGGPVGDPTGGPVGDPTGGPVGDPTGGPVGDPTGGPVGDPTDPPGPETHQGIKRHMRAGTVFSLAHVDDAEPQTGAGICLGDHEQAWLEEFRKAIAECLAGEEEPASNDVKFKVTGYASIAPMNIGNDTSQSENLNCRVANWRAAAVGAFLAGRKEHKERWDCDSVGTNFNKVKSNQCVKLTEKPYRGRVQSGEYEYQFVVDVHQWTNHSEMVKGKPANDGTRPDDRRFDVEIMNRVVHIEVPKGFCRSEASDAPSSP